MNTSEEQDKQDKSRSGYIRRLFSWWPDNAYNASGVSVTKKDSVGALGFIHRRFVYVFRFLEANRIDIEGSTKVRMDYADMLKAWGLSEDRVPSVKRVLLFEIVLYLVVGVGLSGFVLIQAVMTDDASQSLRYMFFGIPVLTLSVAMMIEHAWRLHCLRDRRFTPFVLWVTGRHD